MSADFHPQAVSFSSAGAVVPLEEAFVLLARAVSELSRRGTVVKAAGTKALMRRLSMNTFNEQAYGYANFRAFLQAAAERGAIVLDTAYDQDYVLVLPQALATRGPGPSSDGLGRSTQNAISVSTIQRQQKRIREDLWSTFIDWRKGLARIYDKDTGRAYVFPIEPAPDEPSTISEIREIRRAKPERYIEISPITFDEQVSWMRTFAQRLDRPEINEILRAGFRSDRPAAIFRSTIRAFPDIDEAWRDYLLDRVIARIEEWAAQEKLDINLFQPPSRFSIPTTRTTSPQPSSPTTETTSQTAQTAIDLPTVRARLHSAIDSMPLQELMQIRLPVGYFLG